MGWFQKLKETFTSKNDGLRWADVMSGRTPIYSAFGSNIYASDVVTQAMRCVIDEAMKLTPVHVLRKGTDFVPVPAGDTLQRILNAPNHYMTTAEFLSKVLYYYFSDRPNSWVIPTYRLDGAGRKTYTGLYPVDPAGGVEWLEDANGRLLVKLKFLGDVKPLILPYSDVIHLRRNYGADEYMGGGRGGKADDRGLLQTLNINHQMMQGIGKAMKASQAVNGVVKYGSVFGQEQGAAALAEFEAAIQNSQSGILVLDMKGEYMPIARDLKLVDADTLKFIDEKILRNFGVPLPILTGDYNKSQYEAFFQKTIEPLIVLLSQEFTRVLFTPNERSYGHEVRFFAKELIFMSMDQKIAMFNLLAPTGAVYENEKRVAFGFMPQAELEGKRYMSLNWIDASQANQYQVGKDDSTGDGGEDNQQDGGTNNE